METVIAMPGVPDGKKYDPRPQFEKGRVFKTEAGSELTLGEIVPDGYDPNYIDRVVFKLKKLVPADTTGPRSFFFLEMRFRGGLNVGDKITITGCDLGAIGWPRVCERLNVMC
jgi:hypothetical protein